MLGVVILEWPSRSQHPSELTFQDERQATANAIGDRNLSNLCRHETTLHMLPESEKSGECLINYARSSSDNQILPITDGLPRSAVHASTSVNC